MSQLIYPHSKGEEWSLTSQNQDFSILLISKYVKTLFYEGGSVVIIVGGQTVR